MQIGNRYRLEERLGSGGMAVVYRAYDLKLERHVALKILRRDYSQEPEARQRFQQEAKATAILSHPNIAALYDYGEEDSQLYLVMEYVPGTDLKTLLKQRGAFSLPEALEIMIQASAGIGHAHRVGLVHCDIKPQNILVTPEGRVKVLDFGIARALASISPDEQSEVVWGSPRYFSPEQAAGLAPSPASDVYSLGVVLYELLTGQAPFNAPSAEELARMHREDLPPSPCKLNPAIPSSLEQIILKVLSKEPAQRYRNADQFCQILTSYRQRLGQGPVALAEAFPQPVSSPFPVPPERPAPAPAERPARPPSPPLRGQQPVPAVRPPQRFDWLTWLLALIALVSVLGLIPFWLWVLATLQMQP